MTLPAYAAFAWNGNAGGFLLLPDLGDLPLSAYRGTLLNLHAVQRTRGLPTLLIAARGSGRAAAWRDVLEDAREIHHDYRLPAYITPWSELPTGDEALLARLGQVPTEELRQRHSLPLLRPRRPFSRVPNLVGDALVPTVSPRASEGLGHTALTVSPSDRALMSWSASTLFSCWTGWQPF